MNEIDIAKVTHEVNRAYCSAIGDDSQLPWDDAPQWQKDSAISGVRAHLQEELPVEASHQLWLDEKISHGWVFGIEKDAEMKTHPCVVPFDELPVEQQAKDYLFRAVVQSLRPYYK